MQTILSRYFELLKMNIMSYVELSASLGDPVATAQALLSSSGM